MKPATIAMIPARLGSQRLKQKNLKTFLGRPLIVHAIDRCVEAGCFDQIWINTESDDIINVAKSMHPAVHVHKRPPELADNTATSEDFIAEFLAAHPCDQILQVHSIAPLLKAQTIRAFTDAFIASSSNCQLSCIEDQIEVAYKGAPVNFTYQEKTNSQDLTPVHRITWSITGWRRQAFLDRVSKGETATYVTPVSFFPVDPFSGHVIKTQADLDIAEALAKTTLL